MSKNILVYCGSSAGFDPIYEQEVKKLAAALIKKEATIIFGAGSVGLMGILADEYIRLGGKCHGTLPDRHSGFADPVACPIATFVGDQSTIPPATCPSAVTGVVKAASWKT